MADKIEAKIDLEENAPARVAWEMTKYLAGQDGLRPKNESPETRKYYLDLYAECLQAANGHRLRYFSTQTPAKS